MLSCFSIAFSILILLFSSSLVSLYSCILLDIESKNFWINFSKLKLIFILKLKEKFSLAIASFDIKLLFLEIIFALFFLFFIFTFEVFLIFLFLNLRDKFFFLTFL